MRLLSVPFLLTFAALASAQGEPAPAPALAARVSFLDGEASRTGAGGAEALAVGSAVYVGDLVETRARTRLELTLQDESHLRLGPGSRLEVRAGRFGSEPGDRNVAVRLLLGSVWSTVTHALGAGSTFEVQTANAVAGVRGTTFRVDASQDRSVVVKVYAGAVAVAGGMVVRRHGGMEEEATATPTATPTATEPTPTATPATGGTTTPASSPSSARWEQVLTAMQELRISALGRAERIARFELRPAHDGFERWNRERDERRQRERRPPARPQHRLK